MSDETRTELTFDELESFKLLCGSHDQHLELLRRRLHVEIKGRGNTLTLTGAAPDVAVTSSTLVQLYELLRGGHKLYPSDIRRSADIVAGGSSLREVLLDTVLVTSGKRNIAPKNLNQKAYLDAMREGDLSFAIGPAGTGKTYLAMAVAISCLQRHEVKRIILTRPAVEAGERLGFLPGDMAEKVNPYLRPLYDALYDMLDVTRVQRLIQDNTIEIAPLAFMRGRTLNDCFVVLDEAQNTTREQMKMFLTRLGFNAKAAVTGDITQVDLDEPYKSGLVHARHVLSGIPGISFCEFTADDVVRHPLVMRIIRAYDEAERRD
ncbi:MAG: PhoH family protein [Myxococcota bacterium]|nr:PhoH family protein [Myxococcota bacterium]